MRNPKNDLIEKVVDTMTEKHIISGEFREKTALALIKALEDSFSVKFDKENRCTDKGIYLESVFRIQDSPIEYIVGVDGIKKELCDKNDKYRINEIKKENIDQYYYEVIKKGIRDTAEFIELEKIVKNIDLANIPKNKPEPIKLQKFGKETRRQEGGKDRSNHRVLFIDHISLEAKENHREEYFRGVEKWMSEVDAETAEIIEKLETCIRKLGNSRFFDVQAISNDFKANAGRKILFTKDRFAADKFRPGIPIDGRFYTDILLYDEDIEKLQKRIEVVGNVPHDYVPENATELGKAVCSLDPEKAVDILLGAPEAENEEYIVAMMEYLMDTTFNYMSKMKSNAPKALKRFIQESEMAKKHFSYSNFFMKMRASTGGRVIANQTRDTESMLEIIDLIIDGVKTKDVTYFDIESIKKYFGVHEAKLNFFTEEEEKMIELLTVIKEKGFESFASSIANKMRYSENFFEMAADDILTTREFMFRLISEFIIFENEREFKECLMDAIRVNTLKIGSGESEVPLKELVKNAIEGVSYRGGIKTHKRYRIETPRTADKIERIPTGKNSDIVVISGPNLPGKIASLALEEKNDFTKKTMEKMLRGGADNRLLEIVLRETNVGDDIVLSVKVVRETSRTVQKDEVNIGVKELYSGSLEDGVFVPSDLQNIKNAVFPARKKEDIVDVETGEVLNTDRTYPLTTLLADAIRQAVEDFEKTELKNDIHCSTIPSALSDEGVAQTGVTTNRQI